MSTAIEARSGLGFDASVGFPVWNESGIDDALIVSDGSVREVAKQLTEWVGRAQKAASSQGMFDRNAYAPPNNFYDELRAARRAVEEDDIVGGVADVTESFAFQIVKWEGRDADVADIFNQWSAEINLDGIVRKMWREQFGQSQFVVAMEWGQRTYKVRGKTEAGNERKGRYNLTVPVKIRVIDAARVVPVGHSPLGDDWLAWCATQEDVNVWMASRSRAIIDPLMQQFFLGTYTPSDEEKGELSQLGVDTSNLLLMNPEMVWRHTLTKPDYKRFPDLRMKTIFKLLDMKQQLLNADRAMLIGAANYILLIRKGTDDLPAKKQELENLKENYNFIAKIPVIISDHRLEVDIIAPKTDFVLQQERYDVIDTRLLMRLLGTLSPGARGQRNETNVTISRAVARTIENRRHMLRRDIESRVARAIMQHPNNAARLDGKEAPSLVYVPRNVALDVDPETIKSMMSLRSRWEISRETILEFFGLDQAVEHQRRLTEEALYDDDFHTVTPFDSPENNPEGGRPTGGGDPPQNNQAGSGA